MKIKFAQISDSHLFAQPDGQHFGARVWPQLLVVLEQIKQCTDIKFIVFTGDLTQDHSVESYQLFNRAFVEAKITIPVYYLAGNHDDPALLDKYLSHDVFNKCKTVECGTWQIQLIDSKSNTPAGNISTTELARIKALDEAYHQCLLMHHHPVDVGYFIDRHGLKNQAEFWLAIKSCSAIRMISCGHVHRGMTLSAPEMLERTVELYSSPATSITFAKHPSQLIAEYDDIGYRIFELDDNGNVSSCVKHIPLVS
ncbi:metallophosphoesterase [Thalassotalea sp. LPB0316]|uniref:metallophosphoesterase n=1 Tax=Thalassotalea sp. LPB0316 TaxID=2769490 RepID=UPI001869556A|nr:metallophosphoesterase [Thalassotalea sp. LPB0316]QOL26815.1 metallophosphoesterase [Thalassotalea sp. LPB0316]